MAERTAEKKRRRWKKGLGSERPELGSELGPESPIENIVSDAPSPHISQKMLGEDLLLFYTYIFGDS